MGKKNEKLSRVAAEVVSSIGVGLWVATMFGLIAALHGCGGEGPLMPGEEGWDPVASDDPFSRGGTPGGPGTAPNPLVLAPTPETACTTTIAIRGRAQPGSTIVLVSLDGRGAEVTATADSSTGHFCLEATLTQETVNRFRVSLRQFGGTDTASVDVTVTHQTTCDDGDSGEGNDGGGGSLSPNNIANGLTFSSKEAPTGEGSVRHVSDGQLSTVAEWMGGSMLAPWANYNGWVKVALPGVPIERVVIHWRDNATTAPYAFGRRYQVLYSESPMSGDPDPNSGTWKSVAVTDGDGGRDDVRMPRGLPSAGTPRPGDQMPRPRALALWLEQDGTLNFFGYTESFAIREIEVLSADGATRSPLDTADSGVPRLRPPNTNRAQTATSCSAVSGP